MPDLLQTNSLHIGYLGPEGSHSHAAGLKLCSHYPSLSVELAPYASLFELMAAVEAEEIPFGLLPIENALEGSVVEVLETVGLQKRKLQPCLELMVAVNHCLIQRSGHPVKTVVSHPQAIAQCRETLIRLFGPSVRFEFAPSTSEAVRILQEESVDEDCRAAIGTMAAANRYGLKVIQQNVSDAPDNLTRFFLLHAGFPLAQSFLTRLNPTHFKQKTSFCMGIHDRPGALVDVLTLFKTHTVNLSKIESRPSKKRFGEYVFHMDAEGDLTLPRYQPLMRELEGETPFIHLLGPYGCLDEGQAPV